MIIRVVGNSQFCVFAFAVARVQIAIPMASLTSNSFIGNGSCHIIPQSSVAIKQIYYSNIHCTILLLVCVQVYYYALPYRRRHIFRLKIFSNAT